MESLIIVADLGRMKAYRITQDELQPDSPPSFHDLANVDLANQHSRVSDRFSYQAGRFNGGPGGSSIGERHSEEEEAKDQQLEAIADQINELAGKEAGKIYLAAPQTILRELLAILRPEVRKRIQRDLPLNLVKAPKLDLLKRFELG